MKKKTKHNILQPEEIRILLNSPMTFKEKLAYRLLLFTGMRVGEAVHMGKSWIYNGEINIPPKQKCQCKYCQQQFRRKKIHFFERKKEFDKIVYPTKADKKSYNTLQNNWKETRENKGFWTPKSENAVREIPILRQIRPLLKIVLQKSNSTIMEIIPSPASWRQIINKHYKKHLADKLRKDIFPHSLRGTFATILVREIPNLTTFQLRKIMGWANIQTATSYVNLGKKIDKKRIENLSYLRG